MRRLANFIVEKSRFLLVLFIALTVAGLLTMGLVTVNRDMTEYLPEDSRTKAGLSLMNDEFGETCTLNVMFKGLTDAEKASVKGALSSIDNVGSVAFEAGNPESDADGYSLFTLTINGSAYGDEAANVLSTVESQYSDREVYISGTPTEDVASFMARIVLFAGAILLVILLVMCHSWIEPLIFLMPIAMAIALNMGTNAILGSVSNTTQSIAPILQLVLSMDYSIMLIDRYRQYKEGATDKKSAMKQAISDGFLSIASSSVTTIAGLLCLVFMSFTIGLDMGLVLAKGVFLSLVCILFVLPGLVLAFDRVIDKTQKPVIRLKLTGLAKLSYKLRYFVLAGFVLLFVGSFLLKGSTKIEFFLSSSNPDQKVTDEVFEPKNSVVVLYANDEEAKIPALAEELSHVEGVDSVMSYANTLGDELTSAELADEMGVDKSLADMLFYYYFNGDGSETGKITLAEFASFVTDDVADNPQFAEYFEGDALEQIETLKTMADAGGISKERSSAQIAALLDMNEADAADIYMLYFSEDETTDVGALTLDEFVRFIREDVAQNERFSDFIDGGAMEQIDSLAELTAPGAATRKHSSASMARAVGMDRETAAQLYLLYFSTNGAGDTIAIPLNSFVDFILTDVAQNPQYAANFDEATLAQLGSMKAMLDAAASGTVFNAAELSAMTGIDSALVEQLFGLAAAKRAPSVEAMPLKDFMALVGTLSADESFSQYVDAGAAAQLASAQRIVEASASGEKYGAAELAAMTGMDAAVVSDIFGYVSVTGSPVSSMTLPEFTALLLDDISAVPAFSGAFDEAALAQLTALRGLSDAAASNAPLTAEQLSTVTGMDAVAVEQVFTYAAMANISPVTSMTLPDFVTFIVDDVSKDERFTAYFDAATLAQLGSLKEMLDAAVAGTGLTSAQAAGVLSMDEAAVTPLYYYYASTRGDTSSWWLSMLQFVDFIVNDVANHPQYGAMFDAATVSQLKQMRRILNGAASEKAYTSVEMAQLIDMEDREVRQLYAYNVSANGDTSAWSMTLREFVDFISNDVATNPEYSAMIDGESLSGLNSAKTVIDAAEAGTAYTPAELIDALDFDSDLLDEDSLELLYMYYFSGQSASDERVSVYDLFGFITDTVLPDSRFESYFDDGTKTELLDAKRQLEDGKANLVGDKYSRMILATTLGKESDEAYTLVDSLTEKLDGTLSDYTLLGDSAMAHEMRASFSDELNTITLITALAIFLIVAVTFRSVAIPAMLVLLIQCAVYITMGIAYIQGIGIFYLALIIVQAILMGATIDYAILFTSYYRDLRQLFGIKDALARAYSGSIMTIMTSGSILVIITLVVGLVIQDVTTSQVCLTISKGSFVAVVLVVFVLPGLLAALDKFVCKKGSADKKAE